MQRPLRFIVSAVVGLAAALAVIAPSVGSDAAAGFTIDRNFATDQTPLASPWIVFGKSGTGELSAANVEYFSRGLRLWSRDGKGAGVMIRAPRAYGYWTVRMRISPGSGAPTTKVCLLLWPAGTGWPPEIDFNESGDRSRSNQTLHYSDENRMHHTHYAVDQTVWHTYGVRVSPGLIEYMLDGVVMTSVTEDVPVEQEWNLHIRTTPNGHDDATRLDIRRVRISE